MQKCTIVIKCNDQIERYTLEDFNKNIIVFGRDKECDIRISDQAVSRIHGRFVKKNGQWYIQDMNSSNGIFLNQKRLNSPMIVSDGIVLKLGKSSQAALFECKFVDVTENDKRNKQIEDADSLSSEEKTNGSDKVIVIFVAVAVIIFIIGILAVVKVSSLLKNKDVTPTPTPTVTAYTSVTPDANDSEEAYVDYIDADDFYTENSEIVSKTIANESEKTFSEEEMIDFMKTKSFDQFSIETNFSIEGDFLDANEVSGTSSEKHPVYQTFYENSSEEYFSIFVIENSVYAYPLSYIYESGETIETDIIISETENVISYDNVTNTFYETKPSDDAIKVIVVDEINADVLDELTIDKIKSKM